ncbi:hypothetical protein [Acinetobacter baumannii]|uniref:hypothetical protein n=1 Tax=Acinetobacter baumannii TaxID=470 RepID=UPI002940113E|nr:hypothetical protein [Acinetobacter baumannii]MDV4327813.1 phosphatidylinositol 4-kinase [Acinetobacter baumannii]MDV4332473.1 phosphatidylinositol 4-kinase [Acinetobacter baumannii]
MSIEIIEEEGFLDTLRLVSNTSGGCSASTRLATVCWPDGEEADTFIKIFPYTNRNKEIINESFGYLMAKKASLRQSPRAALIKISVDDIPADPRDTFAKQYGFYYAWACRSIGSSNMKKLYFSPPYESATTEEFSKYFHALTEWDDFEKLLTFDDCIGNCDRNPGNIIFINKNDLAIIDHGLIFGGKDWVNNGLLNAHNFQNWLENFFIQQHDGKPSMIAWQPIIDASKNNVKIFDEPYFDEITYKMEAVFNSLIPSVPTTKVVIAILVQYFKDRLQESVARFNGLSSYFNSSVGAIAP